MAGTSSQHAEEDIIPESAVPLRQNLPFNNASASNFNDPITEPPQDANEPELPQDTTEPRAGETSRPSVRQAFIEAINLEPQVNIDHVSIQFHPSTKKLPKTVPIKNYAPLTYHNTKASDVPPPKVDPKPWAPFRTRLDFEVAELALSAHMNREQTNTLLSLLERCASDPKELTFRSATDMEKVWEAARTCHATSVSLLGSFL